jgi:predicted phage-related endonuclease
MWAPDHKRGVDAKCLRFFREGWGEPGTDEVPRHVLCQAHHFNMLFGTEVWYVAALGGGQEYREYEIPHDPEMDELILDTLRDWWDRHIVQGEAPPIDGSSGAAEYLKQKHPRETDDVRVATPQEVSMLERYRALQASKATMEAELAELENRIKELVGDSEGITWEHGKVTWKEAKGRTRFDKKRFAKDHPDMAQEYETTGDPTRVFRKRFYEED